MRVQRRRGRCWQLAQAKHRFELLEDRLALSSAPAVADVSLASSEWSPAFYAYLANNNLGDQGYSVPVGSTDQETPLPWSNIDQLRITFTEDVYVDAADLSLSGVNSTEYTFADFEYLPEERIAVWTLSNELPTDRFWIDLAGDGLDPVQDLDLNTLDGEWVDSTSSFSSGNGTAGGDFEFSFRVLPGDALGHNLLDYDNGYYIVYKDGYDVHDALYDPKADVNGNGLIESSDYYTVFNDMWASAPGGAQAGSLNDAPTTAGLGYRAITNDVIDEVFSLYDAFDDAEDSDSQLTYAITSNSDPSLFDSVSINSQSGELEVNTASGVSGRARIGVSATDQSGLSVETSLTIDVARQNVIPSLTVSTTDAGQGQWIIEGWVSDTDENLDELYVVLIGYLSQRVSVAETGYFWHVVELDPTEGGSVWASVSDSAGATSTSVYFEVGWS